MPVGSTIFAPLMTIANLCHRYTCVLKIPQPRNFLTMLRKHITTCTIHKNNCLAHLRIVATRFSHIVLLARSHGHSIIAVFILYLKPDFRSNVPYGFIHPCSKHLYSFRPQSRSMKVRKGAYMRASALQQEGTLSCDTPTSATK